MSPHPYSMWRLGALAGAIALLASCGGGDVGVTVSGLSGTLVLQNNGGDDLTIKANGEFHFATGVKPNSTYNVTVRTQPLWQNCSVSRGSGSAAANVSAVNITCVAAQARVTTLAGTGLPGQNNGSASVATFNQLGGIVARPDGSLVVSDARNNLLRNISPTGDVTTFAGGGPFGSVDGNGVAASFQNLEGLALAANGDIYVADVDGHRIRRVTPAGDVSTIAGNGVSTSVDGNGTSATFNNPTGVAANSNGDLYVVEKVGNVVRKITPSGDVSTLAGSSSSGFTDGNGSAAAFRSPTGVAVDTSGNLYVADSANHSIRKITPAGNVTTLAGSSASGTTDGVGAMATFATPMGVTIGRDGNLFVVDNASSQVRMVTPSGVVSTLAGDQRAQGSQDGIGAAATFANPKAVAMGPDGALYVADTNSRKIRKLTPVRLP